MRVVRALMLLAVTLATPAGAEQTPRVISDTQEYCGSLVARLEATPAARREPSRSLVEQGVALCGTGHVRTGIAKLRRALRATQTTTQAGATGGD